MGFSYLTSRARFEPRQNRSFPGPLEECRSPRSRRFRCRAEYPSFSDGQVTVDDHNRYGRPVASEAFRDCLPAEVGVTDAGKSAGRGSERRVVF